MKTTPFLWTNDDVSAGNAAEMQCQLDLLDEFHIPGTFFVPPFRGERAITDDPELLDMIRRAKEKGHEFHQHGTHHTAFECGVPELWMLDFSPPTRQRYDDKRLEIEKLHTFEAQVRTIALGQRVWREAFGEDSEGFRPPWGAFCGNFYRALDALGFQWVSSRIVTTTSWKWNQGLWDVDDGFRENLEWTPHILPDTNLWEIPMTGGDYAFRVPNEADKIEAMVDLAMREFEFCHERDLPFIPICHFHGLARNDDSGYAVHRALLPRILESGKAELMTMSQIPLESE
jgi:peptidoglycan/xylan/chitin deacetylase (PgdA/CDA1 family)